MKRINSTVLLTLSFVILSLAIYIIQIAQFDSPRDTAFYFLQDMAFLPLQVAIVTIVLGRFISAREKRERLKKTNMMVGAFFSEVGNPLIEQLNKQLVKDDYEARELIKYLKIGEDWSDRDFKRAAAAIKNCYFEICFTGPELQNLRDLLMEKRYFIFLFLENPNLLEHEEFTDMLWAVFHLSDELLAREEIANLPENDLAHLNNDVRRTLNPIFAQWISYMSHLKVSYPYLFSLEMRKSPFNGGGKIIIG